MSASELPDHTQIPTYTHLHEGSHCGVAALLRYCRHAIPVCDRFRGLQPRWGPVAGAVRMRSLLADVINALNASRGSWPRGNGVPHAGPDVPTHLAGCRLPSSADRQCRADAAGCLRLRRGRRGDGRWPATTGAGCARPDLRCGLRDRRRVPGGRVRSGHVQRAALHRARHGGRQALRFPGLLQPGWLWPPRQGLVAQWPVCDHALSCLARSR